MERLRTFIAIELPDGIKRSFERVQEILRKADADVRWVRTENAHLTLKFLGPTMPEQVQQIKQIISGTCAETDDFEIEFGGLGVFPRKKNPRVVWVGVRKGVEKLQSVQKRIEKAVAKIGFKPEGRGYSPHITLGRFKSGRGKQEIIEQIEKHEDIECGRTMAGSIYHIRSTLSGSGAIYDNLFSAELRPINPKEEN